MANYANILAQISAAITTNDNEEITGAVLRAVLLDMVDALGEGYQYKGIATPDTTPSTSDGLLFYIGAAGSYTNFGASANAPFVVDNGEVAIFRWDSVWTREKIRVTELVEIVDDLTSGGSTKALSAEMGKYLKTLIGDIEVLYQDVDITQLTPQDCSLGSSGWYMDPATNAQRHIAVPTTAGTTYILKAVTTGGAWYGWVTSSYSPPYTDGNTIPYVSGTQRASILSNEEQRVTAPEESAYLILTTVDGVGASVAWSVKVGVGNTDSVVDLIQDINDQIAGLPQMQSDIDDLLEYVDIPDWDAGTEMDLSSYSESPCSVGNSQAGWYRNGASGPQSHIAVPITAGTTYRIMPRVVSGVTTVGFAGIVTSSYSPPYTNGDTIPYVSGASRISINSQTNYYFQAPSDAAYLILTTVDGAGASVVWRMWNTTETADRETLEERLETLENSAGAGESKLRICSWNIGHFSGGTASDTTITQAQFSAMRQKWAEKINAINADVMMCCEYNTNFVNAEGTDPAITAATSVFALYPYRRIGVKYEYNQQALFANRTLGQATAVILTPSQQTRYLYVSTIALGGKTVKIAETHLDFQTDAYRAQQITQLISYFANDDYVILGGDFNVDSADEFDAFVNAGWTVVNHGYLGDLATYPASSPTAPIDNIVCKGFQVNGIEVLSDADLSDHSAVAADFKMLI